MKTKLSILLTVILAVIGTVITIVVYLVQINTINTYNENLPYISLGDNIKNKTTKAHLWFEELMAGDASINFETDVLVLLKNSAQIIEGAIKGEQTELGKFTENQEPEVKRLLKLAKDKLQAFIELSEQRFANKVERDKKLKDTTTLQKIDLTGEEAGGKLDQEFDGSYESLQSTLDELINFINKEVSKDIRNIQIIAWATILFLALIFIVLAILIFRVQGSNEKTVEKDKMRLESETIRIAKLTEMVSQIASGNLQVKLDLDVNKDELAKALVEMQQQLIKINREDKQRNWVNEGFAQLGLILRSDAEEIKEWYFRIIAFIVNYLQINQGGIYIIEDDEEFEEKKALELKACLAYNRKKYLRKKVPLTEGLIGACILEQKAIYLSEIPQNYLSITSGLGEANPNYLMLIPLKNSNQILGVLEIASFQALAEYQRDFLEKAAENIAGSLFSVKANETTKKLLIQSQIQTEQLKAAEEEMRQNLEELSATQEEMRRRETEYLAQIAQFKQ